MLQNVVAPDLTLICLDINDWVTDIAPGTYDLATAATHAEQLRKIVTAARVTGDVILMTGAPSKITAKTRDAQDAILQATRQVASICGVPLIDVHAAWGTQETAVAAELYLPGNDDYHPGAAGYEDIAKKVAAVITG
jgi:lysophospholipase L1-like esterase